MKFTLAYPELDCPCGLKCSVEVGLIGAVFMAITMRTMLKLGVEATCTKCGFKRSVKK